MNRTSEKNVSPLGTATCTQQEYLKGGEVEWVEKYWNK